MLWAPRGGATCAAIAASAARPRTRGRWSAYNTRLERLTQDLEDMPPELRPCIQEEDAVVCQRHLAWPGEVPTGDPPHIGDRLGRIATWAGRDARRAGAGQAGDAVDARGLAGRTLIDRSAHHDARPLRRGDTRASRHRDGSAGSRPPRAWPGGHDTASAHASPVPLQGLISLPYLASRELISSRPHGP
jgi:hypothetical protein